MKYTCATGHRDDDGGHANDVSTEARASDARTQTHKSLAAAAEVVAKAARESRVVVHLVGGVAHVEDHLPHGHALPLEVRRQHAGRQQGVHTAGQGCRSSSSTGGGRDAGARAGVFCARAGAGGRGGDRGGVDLQIVLEDAFESQHAAVAVAAGPCFLWPRRGEQVLPLQNLFLAPFQGRVQAVDHHQPVRSFSRLRPWPCPGVCLCLIASALATAAVPRGRGVVAVDDAMGTEECAERGRERSEHHRHPRGPH